jgi:hypothetical protein
MAGILRCNDCLCLRWYGLWGLIHARLQGLTCHSRTEVAAVGSHCSPRKHATHTHTRSTGPRGYSLSLSNTQTRHASQAQEAVPKHDKDARASSYTPAWKLCTHKAHRSKATLCTCERCRCAAHTSQEASQHSTAKVQPVYHTERRTADCTLQSLNATSSEEKKREVVQQMKAQQHANGCATRRGEP